MLLFGLTLCSCSNSERKFKVVNHTTYKWSSSEPELAGENQSILPLPLPEADTSTNSLPINASIKNGELWLWDSASMTQELITQTNGAIISFVFSPNRKYLSCLRYVEFDSLTLQPDSVYNLIFVNCAMKTAKEFRSEAKYLDFIHWEKWISKSRAIFRINDDLTMGPCYVFDAFRDTLENTNYAFYGDDAPIPKRISARNDTLVNH